MKQFKRMAVMLGGGTMLALGVTMILLPGPAIIVIPVGLAILAIEFAWARHWLRAARTVLSCPSLDPDKPNEITAISMRRSLEFLFRRGRSALFPR